MKTAPFWWEDAGAPKAPPLQPLPRDIDIAIIGAGLTGLSAARTAAKAGKSVLVLEAGVPGIGASSRNGGMIVGGHRLSLEKMETLYGDRVALGLLQEAHLDSGHFCREVMKEEAIECDYRQTGRFIGFWRDTELEAQTRYLDSLAARIPITAHIVPRTRQHEEVNSDLYRGGAVFPHHGALNPAKWTAGLLQAALRAGAQVHANTAVTSVRPDNGGHLVTTPRGDIRAGAVLAATNGYTPYALGAHKRRIIPVPSFIVATEPLGTDRIRDLFPNGRMIVETRVRHCYFRPSPDGLRVIFGGRAAMFNAPENLVRRQMRALLTQVFPQLRGVKLSHSWRGRTGFTFNQMPNIGRIDGIWHAMGYSGSGNAIAPWLGHKAALKMIGDPEGETAFSHTGLPTRWWHRGSPWFLPFADIVFRGRDALGNLGR